MGLIELTYWRIRIEIFTAAIENFSKISRVEGIFVQEIRVWFLPFLIKMVNSRQTRLQISPFLWELEIKKIEIKAQKYPWQTSKCPWKLFFEMPVNFQTCPWKFWKKWLWNFRPCPWQFSMICPWKVNKCPWRNSNKVLSRALWCVTKKKTLGEEEGRG